MRMLGSVGQEEISEMADIGKVLIGRGWAEYQGETLAGAEALRRAPDRADHARAQRGAGADQLERGHDGPWLAGAGRHRRPDREHADRRRTELRSVRGQPLGDPPGGRPGPAPQRSGDRRSRLRELLDESELWRPGAARNLQDPLSIRCVPQTHGAVYDALSVARGMMEIELNSASDNPLVLVDEGAIVSVGNFDVTSLAMAFDYVRLGIAHAAQVANERVQKLLWHHFSGLPTGLARQEGSTGGLRPLGRSFAARCLRGPLPRKPGVARLPRPARGRGRGPRIDGAAGGQRDLVAGQPRPPDGRA